MGDRENTGQQQQQGGANAQPPLPPVPALPASHPEEPHPHKIHTHPDHKPKTSEQWFKSPDWWMVGLTALLFLVGAVTLKIFYDQFGEMQKQTRILNTQAQQATADSVEAAARVERQLKIAERQVQVAESNVKAIQGQTRSTQRALINIPAFDAAMIQEGQPIVAKIRFENIGNTSARRVQMEVVIDKVNNGNDPIFDYRWDHAGGTTGLLLKGEGLDIVGQRVVHQRTPPPKPATDLPLSHQEWQDLLNNKIFFVVYARVRYLDTSGVSHWTRRCEPVAIPPPPGVVRSISSRKCSDYSDTDNN